MQEQNTNIQTETNSSDANASHENKNYKKIAIIVCISTLVLWALSFFLLFWDTNCRGTFGDMFGAVNALFSGLAFSGLIVTLIMQHEELGLQRKELAQTNEELAAQREEFEAQTKTMKIQRFENTLFNMLSLQHDIVNSLYYLPKDGADHTPESKVRYVFDVFYNTKITRFQYGHEGNVYGIKGLIRVENTPDAYRHVKEISIFDNYFRHLYRIFKYIETSPLIDETERYDYACIVRAQLSDYELLMLFYNALNVNDNGSLKFKQLIEKYAVFNNIREDMLAREHEDYKLYYGGAYVHQR